MINIDELTIKQIKHIQSLLKAPIEVSHPYEIGKNYFIRTVTHHLVGRLIKVTSKELVLEEASWIADDGYELLLSSRRPKILKLLHCCS